MPKPLIPALKHCAEEAGLKYVPKMLAVSTEPEHLCF